MSGQEVRSGDAVIRLFATLANPHRVRVIAALNPGRCHVSELARRLQISRPLLQVHLQRLEAAGLVRSETVLAQDGRARRYYELEPFRLVVTADALAAAAADLSPPKEDKT